MTFHHLTCNRISLRANEPMYCKFFIYQKQAPLNIWVFKHKILDNFFAYYSRTESMPTADRFDGDFSNVRFVFPKLFRQVKYRSKNDMK